jgi:hypothetical protein
MLAHLYYGNTHTVELEDLYDPHSSPLTHLDDSATVTAKLYDSDGALVSNGSCTLSYVAGSDGNFVGYLSYLADISVNARYTILVTANDGAGKVGRWDIPANCVYREGDSV